jgi:hypothetical protein
MLVDADTGPADAPAAARAPTPRPTRSRIPGHRLAAAASRTTLLRDLAARPESFTAHPGEAFTSGK